MWPTHLFGALLLGLLSLHAWSEEAGAVPPAGPGAELLATHQRLTVELGNNPFRRPLYIASTDATGALAGDVYAVLDFPFAAVEAAFGSAANWCDILILHIDTKYCRAEGSGIGVQIGGKGPEPLDLAGLMNFAFRRVTTGPGHFRADLSADKGPMATRNHRIRLEAVPLAAGRTFLHLSYAYESGMAGRLAMQVYLTTIGRNKVGFTRVGTTDGGEPVYIQGVRALVERNTMRYFLAIDAYLGALTAPADERFERRIALWYTASEQYARQLHDVDRDSYIAMKRDEYRRQQAGR